MYNICVIIIGSTKKIICLTIFLNFWKGLSILVPICMMNCMKNSLQPSKKRCRLCCIKKKGFFQSTRSWHMESLPIKPCTNPSLPWLKRDSLKKMGSINLTIHYLKDTYKANNRNYDLNPLPHLPLQVQSTGDSPAPA